ncbi:MAG TPA: citrate/2-methylcitrate synthase, partial [Bryobacteraceae bacterium]
MGTPANRTEGLEGIVAADSEICYIDGTTGVLSYRGYNIHTLADHATFEEVIFLLWHGRLPDRAELIKLKSVLVERRPIPAPVTAFLGSVAKSNPMDVLRTAISMLSLYDPEAGDESPEANVRKAERLMAQTATIVTTFQRLRSGNAVVDGDPALGFAANFLYTLTGNRPDGVMDRAFDVAMILHADHEFNASTFAARVTAATLADMYSSVTAAIGALKGPLHGGANQDVIRLLLHAGSEE